MRLNKTTSHALRVLAACARPGDGLRKVAELAAELGLSEQNVFKIVHLLSRAGLLSAERGRHGGVRLARSAPQIRIGEVVLALETMTHSGGDRPASAPGSSGEHGALFDEAFRAFLSVLNRSTVADMARSTGTAAPTRTRSQEPVGTRRKPASGTLARSVKATAGKRKPRERARPL